MTETDSLPDPLAIAEATIKELYARIAELEALTQVYTICEGLNTYSIQKHGQTVIEVYKTAILPESEALARSLCNDLNKRAKGITKAKH